MGTCSSPAICSWMIFVSGFRFPTVDAIYLRVIAISRNRPELIWIISLFYRSAPMSKWRSGETSGSIAPSLAASRDSPSFTDGLHGEMMGKSWDGNGEIMGEKGSMINLHTHTHTKRTIVTNTTKHWQFSGFNNTKLCVTPRAFRRGFSIVIRTIRPLPHPAKTL